jgi:sugar lactone lactonase YvrE
MVASLAAECILECGCLLGEGPVWNPNTGELDFVDIMGGIVRCRPGVRGRPANLFAG